MLTGHTSSGSADAPRLCRGCSHPHRHLPARAAPSFGRLLRQPPGAGLPPPLKQQRLTAHETSPQRLRHHLRRPLAGSRNLLMKTAGNTVPVTDPALATLLADLRRSPSVGGWEVSQGALISTRTLPEISEFAAIANASLTSSIGST